MSGSIDSQLKSKKLTISEFFETTINVLTYLSLITTDSQFSGKYRISKQSLEGRVTYLRPINDELFIKDPSVFSDKFYHFLEILGVLKRKSRELDIIEKNLIDSVLYTIQQSIGAGFDLLVSSNSSRKHVGNRFEELIKVVFDELGVSNKKTVLQIPYESDEGKKIYKCENDLILSPFEKVRGTNFSMDPSEIVVSIKTTSKDRMGKIFIDKLLLERFIGKRQKVIGIFLNDVQRKENGGISHTLVSNLFMVYTQFLIPLDGIYYLDPPPNAGKKPFSNHMKKFSDLITGDLDLLFTS